MNERFDLNAELVRAHLAAEDRKSSYLAKQLGVSQSLVDKMLAGRVPKPRTLEKLAALLCVQVSDLLIPKKDAA